MSETPIDEILVCTCLYSPGDEGYWADPECPTHVVPLAP